MILLPITPGELLDRLTILEIKAAEVRDPAKLENIRQELKVVRDAWELSAYVGLAEGEVAVAKRELLDMNRVIWEAENALRHDSGNPMFMLTEALKARVANDRRTAAKRAINEALGVTHTEEKDYAGNPR